MLTKGINENEIEEIEKKPDDKMFNFVGNKLETVSSVVNAKVANAVNIVTDAVLPEKFEPTWLDEYLNYHREEAVRLREEYNRWTTEKMNPYAKAVFDVGGSLVESFLDPINVAVNLKTGGAGMMASMASNIAEYAYEVHSLEDRVLFTDTRLEDATGLAMTALMGGISGGYNEIEPGRFLFEDLPLPRKAMERKLPKPEDLDPETRGVLREIEAIETSLKSGRTSILGETVKEPIDTFDYGAKKEELLEEIDVWLYADSQASDLIKEVDPKEAMEELEKRLGEYNFKKFMRKNPDFLSRYASEIYIKNTQDNPGIEGWIDTKFHPESFINDYIQYTPKQEEIMDGLLPKAYGYYKILLKRTEEIAEKLDPEEKQMLSVYNKLIWKMIKGNDSYINGAVKQEKFDYWLHPKRTYQTTKLDEVLDGIPVGTAYEDNAGLKFTTNIYSLDTGDVHQDIVASGIKLPQLLKTYNSIISKYTDETDTFVLKQFEEDIINSTDVSGFLAEWDLDPSRKGTSNFLFHPKKRKSKISGFIDGKLLGILNDGESTELKELEEELNAKFMENDDVAKPDKREAAVIASPDGKIIVGDKGSFHAELEEILTKGNYKIQEKIEQEGGAIFGVVDKKTLLFYAEEDLGESSKKENVLKFIEKNKENLKNQKNIDYVGIYDFDDKNTKGKIKILFKNSEISSIEEDSQYMKQNGIPFQNTSKGNLDKRLPKLYSDLSKGKVPEIKEDAVIIDIGAGLGYAGQQKLRDAAGIKNKVVPYDAYVEGINDYSRVTEALEAARAEGKEVVLINSNVLNVIPERGIFGENKDGAYVEDLAKKLEEEAIKNKAKLLITVYEGDKKGPRVMGGKDGNRTFQSNEPLSYYKKYFSHPEAIVKDKGYIVYNPEKIKKSQLESENNKNKLWTKGEEIVSPQDFKGRMKNYFHENFGIEVILKKKNSITTDSQYYKAYFKTDDGATHEIDIARIADHDRSFQGDDNVEIRLNKEQHRYAEAMILEYIQENRRSAAEKIADEVEFVVGKAKERGGNIPYGKKIGGKVYRYTGNNQVEVTDGKTGELLYRTLVDDWNGKDEPVITKIIYADGTEKIPTEKARQVYHHKHLFMDSHSLSSEDKIVFDNSKKRSEFINSEMDRLGIDKKSIGYEKKWLEIEKKFEQKPKVDHNTPREFSHRSAIFLIDDKGEFRIADGNETHSKMTVDYMGNYGFDHKGRKVILGTISKDGKTVYGVGSDDGYNGVNNILIEDLLSDNKEKLKEKFPNIEEFYLWTREQEEPRKIDWIKFESNQYPENEIKPKLDQLFLDEDNYFEVTDETIKDTIFLNNVDGKVLGWTADNEWYKGKATRGNDHNSLYLYFDGERDNFDDIAKEIAIIVPEEKMVYYTGEDKLIKKWIKKLGYKIQSDSSSSPSSKKKGFVNADLFGFGLIDRLMKKARPEDAGSGAPKKRRIGDFFIGINKTFNKDNVGEFQEIKKKYFTYENPKVKKGYSWIMHRDGDELSFPKILEEIGFPNVPYDKNTAKVVIPDTRNWRGYDYWMDERTGTPHRYNTAKEATGMIEYNLFFKHKGVETILIASKHVDEEQFNIEIYMNDPENLVNKTKVKKTVKPVEEKPGALVAVDKIEEEIELTPEETRDLIIQHFYSPQTQSSGGGSGNNIPPIDRLVDSAEDSGDGRKSIDYRALAEVDEKVRNKEPMQDWNDYSLKGDAENLVEAVGFIDRKFKSMRARKDKHSISLKTEIDYAYQPLLKNMRLAEKQLEMADGKELFGNQWTMESFGTQAYNLVKDIEPRDFVETLQGRNNLEFDENFPKNFMETIKSKLNEYIALKSENDEAKDIQYAFYTDVLYNKQKFMENITVAVENRDNDFFYKLSQKIGRKVILDQKDVDGIARSLKGMGRESRIKEPGEYSIINYPEEMAIGFRNAVNSTTQEAKKRGGSWGEHQNKFEVGTKWGNKSEAKIKNGIGVKLPAAGAEWGEMEGFYNYALAFEGTEREPWDIIDFIYSGIAREKLGQDYIIDLERSLIKDSQPVNEDFLPYANTLKSYDQETRNNLKEALGGLKVKTSQYRPNFFNDPDKIVNNHIYDTLKNYLYYKFLGSLGGIRESSANKHLVNSGANALGWKRSYDFFHTTFVEPVQVGYKAWKYMDNVKKKTLEGIENPSDREFVKSFIEERVAREPIWNFREGKRDRIHKGIKDASEVASFLQTLSNVHRKWQSELATEKFLRNVLDQENYKPSPLMTKILRNSGIDEKQFNAIKSRINSMDESEFRDLVYSGKRAQGVDLKIQSLFDQSKEVMGYNIDYLRKVNSNSKIEPEEEMMYFLKRYSLGAFDRMKREILYHYDNDGFLIENNGTEYFTKTLAKQSLHRMSDLGKLALSTTILNEGRKWLQGKISGSTEDEMVETKLAAIVEGDVLGVALDYLSNAAIDVTGVGIAWGSSSPVGSLVGSTVATAKRAYSSDLTLTEATQWFATTVLTPSSVARGIDNIKFQKNIPNRLTTFSKEAQYQWSSKYKIEAQLDQIDGKLPVEKLVELINPIDWFQYFMKNSDKINDVVGTSPEHTDEEKAGMAATVMRVVEDIQEKTVIAEVMGDDDLSKEEKEFKLRSVGLDLTTQMMRLSPNNKKLINNTFEFLRIEEDMEKMIFLNDFNKLRTKESRNEFIKNQFNPEEYQEFKNFLKNKK